MIERLAMLVAVEKKARVRRDVERRQLQSVKLQIHAVLSSKKPRRAQSKGFAPIIPVELSACRFQFYKPLGNNGGTKRINIKTQNNTNHANCAWKRLFL
jgi:hypothetical protein